MTERNTQDISRSEGVSIVSLRSYHNTTQRHKPEDLDLEYHRRESLKTRSLRHFLTRNVNCFSKSTITVQDGLLMVTTQLHLLPRSRTCGSTLSVLNMPSWRDALLKHRDNFTVTVKFPYLTLPYFTPFEYGPIY
jgi:hypothetical protein